MISKLIPWYLDKLIPDILLAPWQAFLQKLSTDFQNDRLRRNLCPCAAWWKNWTQNQRSKSEEKIHVYLSCCENLQLDSKLYSRAGQTFCMADMKVSRLGVPNQKSVDHKCSLSRGRLAQRINMRFVIFRFVKTVVWNMPYARMFSCAIIYVLHLMHGFEVFETCWRVSCNLTIYALWNIVDMQPLSERKLSLTEIGSLSGQVLYYDSLQQQNTAT